MVSLMPPCLRAMTVPSKTWIRSREPSLMRTCTRTVSPTFASGSSSFMYWLFRALTKSISLSSLNIRRSCVHMPQRTHLDFRPIKYSMKFHENQALFTKIFTNIFIYLQKYKHFLQTFSSTFTNIFSLTFFIFYHSLIIIYHRL